MFNAIDPSPSYTRDLDPAAHGYIAQSSKDWPKHETRLTDADRAIQTLFAARVNIVMRKVPAAGIRPISTAHHAPPHAI